MGKIAGLFESYTPHPNEKEAQTETHL